MAIQSKTINSGRVMMIQFVPNRPAISNVLIKASANVAFRAILLSSPQDALDGMDLPPDDVAILTDVQASSLPEYARKVKTRLMSWTP